MFIFTAVGDFVKWIFTFLLNVKKPYQFWGFIILIVIMMTFVFAFFIIEDDKPLLNKTRKILETETNVER
jgi:hypothetical protein